MLKKYSILIQAPKNAPQIADNVLKEFDCEISDPSIWLPLDNTAKGLAFLDKKGKQLNSSIFKNQAFFEADDVNEKAIEALIYAKLFEHYQFERSDVKIIVSPL